MGIERLVLEHVEKGISSAARLGMVIPYFGQWAYDLNING